MEKPLIKPKLTKKQKVLRLCYMGVLSGLTLVFLLLLSFPIFPSAPWLRYEFGDLPMLIVGFMMGPIYGIATVAVTSLLQSLISAGDFPWGFLMHFIASGTLIAVSSLIYRRLHTRKGALISLLCGSVAMIIVIIPANLLITPIYTGMDTEAIWAIIPVSIAFTALKAFGNSAIAFFIYKPLHRLLGRFD